MYMQDPFPWTDHTHRTGRIPWQWGWGARLGPNARARVRYRRRLAAIERDLTANAPALTSKFAVFNHLTKGERPVGVEQVPASAWPRPRPVHLAVLLALAAIVTMSLIISAHFHPAVRPCAANAAAPAAASAPVHGLGCHAYANTRQ